MASKLEVLVMALSLRDLSIEGVKRKSLWSYLFEKISGEGEVWFCVVNDVAREGILGILTYSLG